MLWKQRAKIRVAVDGDENTCFFHACANQRRRRNSISLIEHNGCELHGHAQKAATLHGFYMGLLGTTIATEWPFHLSDLYPEGSLSLSELDADFQHKEIYAAFRYMKQNSSPGPDGFGPLFFKCAWSTIAPDIIRFFFSFPQL
jgi:hypothetical protein